MTTPRGYLADLAGLRFVISNDGAGGEDTEHPERAQVRLIGFQVADNAELGTTDVTVPSPDDGGGEDADDAELIVEEFTSSGTWTRPEGVEEWFLFGVGGGGPGGGGASGLSASTSVFQTNSSGAGAGGGGAKPSWRRVAGTEATYDVQIGDGGTPGTGGLAGTTGSNSTTDGVGWNHGNDGSSTSSNDTIFSAPVAGTLAVFPGGAAGKGGLFHTSTFFAALGGGPVRGSVSLRAFNALNTFLGASFSVAGYAMGFLEFLFGSPGHGGCGGRTGGNSDSDTSIGPNVASTGCPGRPSEYTTSVAPPGTPGTAATSPGSSSGGGGGSSLGPGGRGGHGAAGKTVGGDGNPGGDAEEPAAGNYGAGGGGGAAGGNAYAGGIGGKGGKGGDGKKGHKGRLLIAYVKRPTA